MSWRTIWILMDLTSFLLGVDIFSTEREIFTNFPHWQNCDQLQCQSWWLAWPRVECEVLGVIFFLVTIVCSKDLRSKRVAKRMNTFHIHLTLLLFNSTNDLEVKNSFKCALISLPLADKCSRVSSNRIGKFEWQLLKGFHVICMNEWACICVCMSW